jgi:hypothetical protein
LKIKDNFLHLSNELINTKGLRMKKMIGASLALTTMVAFANPTPATLAPLVNGVYKSQQGNAMLKVVDSDESGLRVAAVFAKKITDTDHQAPHAVVFDDRSRFARINDKTYVSKYRNCIATLTLKTSNSFKVSVNSRDACFVHHSQFNAASATVVEAREAEPFIGVTFSLTNDPVSVKYFNNFD